MPNVFLCCVYNAQKRVRGKFEISERVNEYEQLVKYFSDDTLCHVGFNSLNYDAPIITNLLLNRAQYRGADYRKITSDCFYISNDIIGHDAAATRHLRYKELFKHIDLLTMLFSKALRVSLKEMEITMCYPNVQEMTVPWNEDLDRERIDELIGYCHNDVGATTRLLGLCRGDIRLRQGIEKEFGIECLSKDGVGIGVDIFTKFICAEMHISRNELHHLVTVPRVIDVGKLILPIIKFKTEKFQDVLRWFRSIKLSTEDALNEVEGELTGEKKKYKKKVLFNNLIHTFALGGIHSENRPAVHASDERFTIRDLDVASYYPQLIIEWGIAPEYIREPFLNVMSRIRKERLHAKATKDKQRDLTLKLCMNSISGNYKNQYSAFYSPDSNVSMCVNGQLLLAMLIEDCELAGFECIASNTDGATFKVQNGRENEFRAIASEWEKMSKMQLEEAVYEKMVILAVNDYVAFKKGYSEVKDKIHFHSPIESIKLNEVPVLIKDDEVSILRETYIKEKGMFITSPRLGKGMDNLIVAKALQEYFGKGVPIQEAVTKSPHIWDFVKFERVGKQFDVVWNSEEQQRTNRFYVSQKGAYLYKVKEDQKFNQRTGVSYTVKSYHHALKGYGVQLMNRWVDREMSDYQINYRYYISQCNSLIHQLQPAQEVLF
jgi:hypothetical protein